MKTSGLHGSVKTLIFSYTALYPQLDFTDENIQRIVGIFDTNAIEIRLAQSEVMALYEMACMLEHSCSPNIRLTFDDKYNVREMMINFRSISLNQVPTN